jgi:hypothetical protein
MCSACVGYEVEELPSVKWWECMRASVWTTAEQVEKQVIVGMGRWAKEFSSFTKELL